MSSIESHCSWKEIDHLESALLYDIIDLSEVGIGTMHVPEGEAHDETPTKFRITKSGEKIHIE